ncbi:magnesium transporter MgtE N-terminal domain-containing protein, partial [Rhizobium ruizarguesonis]
AIRFRYQDAEGAVQEDVAEDFLAICIQHEVDEAIRREIVDQMTNDQIAAAIGEIDSDDAVYILEELDKEDREEILA